MGFSIRHLLVLLVIVLVIFGTKRLRTIGSDLGGAMKGFKKAMNERDEDKPTEQLKSSDSSDSLHSPDSPDSRDATFKSTPAGERDSDKANKG